MHGLFSFLSSDRWSQCKGIDVFLMSLLIGARTELVVRADWLAGTQTCRHTRTHARTYTRTHVHTHAYAHTHTHTHTLYIFTGFIVSRHFCIVTTKRLGQMNNTRCHHLTFISRPLKPVNCLPIPFHTVAYLAIPFSIHTTSFVVVETPPTTYVFYFVI